MCFLSFFLFFFSFSFSLSFPLKGFRSQPLPERLKLWHRLSAGESVITNNFTTLRNKMNTALIWRGPNWLCDLTVFKVPADLETGFMLAVVLPGKTEVSGLLLWGDRKTHCKLSCLSMELIYPPPSFFTMLLFLLLTINSPQLGGDARFSTEVFLNATKMAIWMPRIITQKRFSFCSFQLELFLF